MTRNNKDTSICSSGFTFLLWSKSSEAHHGCHFWIRFIFVFIVFFFPFPLSLLSLLPSVLLEFFFLSTLSLIIIISCLYKPLPEALSCALQNLNKCALVHTPSLFLSFSPYCFFASAFLSCTTENLFFTCSSVDFSTFIDMPIFLWSVKGGGEGEGER